MKLVNPNNKRKFKVIVVGTGLAGASAAATLGRARLPGRRVHVPRLAAPGALDRRPGRHQRREELPRRRRQRAPPVLRHGQGRRLPLARRPTCIASPRSASTSSTRWWPRACRSPASTAACSTTAASAARRSAARSTPAARPASSCCSARTSSWPARSGSAASRLFNRVELVDTVVVDGRCAGIVTRDLIDRRDPVARRRTPSVLAPAATATSSSCRPTR